MTNDASDFITFSEFQKVKLQVGTIIKAEVFSEAKKPAYKVWVRFTNGETKKSSAQITANYTIEDLLNRQVICVTNLPPKQIGNFISEVLITGFNDENGNVILAVPDRRVEDGSVLY